MNALTCLLGGHWQVPLVMPRGIRTAPCSRSGDAGLKTSRGPAIALFAYWAEGRDLSIPAWRARRLRGFDGAALVARAEQPGRAQARTDEATSRPVRHPPSSVTSCTGDKTASIIERAGRHAAGARAPSGAGAAVDFWYDFSSPFAYLASTQIECERPASSAAPVPARRSGPARRTPLRFWPKRRYFELIWRELP
jgi:hypothetical protein